MSRFEKLKKLATFEPEGTYEPLSDKNNIILRSIKVKEDGMRKDITDMNDVIVKTEMSSFSDISEEEKLKDEEKSKLSKKMELKSKYMTKPWENSKSKSN